MAKKNRKKRNTEVRELNFYAKDGLSILEIYLVETSDDGYVSAEMDRRRLMFAGIFHDALRKIGYGPLDITIR